MFVFAFLLMLCDYALGGVFKLYDYTKGGEIHKIHSIMTEETPEMLILGSSRAVYHYDPEILKDSLGMTVYNAGLEGLGTSVAYVLLQGISQRKFPKVILCEITPHYDLYEGSGSEMNDLYPYIDIKNVKDVVSSFSPNENIKLLSNAYRLNSALFRLIPSIVLTRRQNRNGFSSEPKKMDVDKIKKDSEIRLPQRIKDPNKEKYLRLLIEEAKSNDCILIMSISPIYSGSELTKYQEEINIVNEYNIPVLNHLNDSDFIDNPSLFGDPVHLNKDGSEEISKIVASEIKEILRQRHQRTVSDLSF